MPQVLTEGRRPGEAIMSEANFHRSRENAKIAFSQTIIPNSLLGRKAVPASVVATAAADAGNTAGSGALTLANPAVSSKVKDGVYAVICTEPAANAGTFEVFDPSGKSIGKATVGVAFTKEIKFTIADATDFVAGDRFTVTVEADGTDYEYVAYDPTATDGAEVPVAYSIYGATTPADKNVLVAIIAREAELNGNCIAWPAGITLGQKADATQELEKRQIILRN
ncbi:MAG: head decoration protein [Mesorhizobium sp.]|uniref:head decoration protein n=1 Tax=Mesorhizobium sp. TaxID=1871066 RepID=UPI000FE95129|nr:head decoration protein [Mesorhizobium sp.]RWC91655.1 MAG: head decoration protein [Mesorhizobium sp.]